MHNADPNLNKTCCSLFFLFTYLSVDVFSHKERKDHGGLFSQRNHDPFGEQSGLSKVLGMEWVYFLKYSFERTCLCRANSSTDGQCSSSSSPILVHALGAILSTLNYCLTSNLVTSFHFLFWISFACFHSFHLSVSCCISCYFLLSPLQGIKVQALFSITRGFKLFNHRLLHMKSDKCGTKSVRLLFWWSCEGWN